MGFDAISSNVEEVLLINPSANVFVFGDFNVHHKDWLAFSGWTDRSGELSYNFCISNGLTCMINFLTQISGCDSDNPALLDFFLLTLLVLILKWLSLNWEILLMWLSQFPLTFLQTQKKDGPFLCIAYGYSLADWDGLCNLLRDVPWKSNFQCSASAASSEFCEWFQVRIWCINLSLQISGQASLTSMVFSCFCCCRHSL